MQRITKRHVITYLSAFAFVMAIVVVIGLALPPHLSVVATIAWVFNCVLLGIASAEIGRRFS